MEFKEFILHAKVKKNYYIENLRSGLHRLGFSNVMYSYVFYSGCSPNIFHPKMILIVRYTFILCNF